MQVSFTCQGVLGQDRFKFRGMGALRLREDQRQSKLLAYVNALLENSTVLICWAIITPPLFVSFFVCFFVSKITRKTVGLICMKFSGKVWSDHGTTWLHFWSIPRNRAMRNTGRGLLCFRTAACFVICVATEWRAGTRS